jgi:hypothetical protein
MMMNDGFKQEEIDQLKAECEDEGQNFVLVEDEEDFDDESEFAHFQFVGMHEGKEVIYDALLSTLSLHHSSLLYEEAEKKVIKIYKDFVPFEQRVEGVKVNEEAEQMIEELIEEMEDEETIKVSEFVEIELDFEYGIGLDIALNVEEITVEVIEDFIKDFNAGTVKLDKTMYSFKHGFEED